MSPGTLHSSYPEITAGSSFMCMNFQGLPLYVLFGCSLSYIFIICLIILPARLASSPQQAHRSSPSPLMVLHAYLELAESVIRGELKTKAHPLLLPWDVC